jgi:hypothetical protein
MEALWELLEAARIRYWLGGVRRYSESFSTAGTSEWSETWLAPETALSLCAIWVPPQELRGGHDQPGHAGRTHG